MPLIESAIGGIAGSIFDQAIKVGKYAVNEIKGNYSAVQHTQRVIAAANAYIDNYFNRHCQIKIMPGLMKEPLSLESIYTDVKLLNQRSIRAFADAGELESTFRAKGKRGFGDSDAKRVSGIEIANCEPFLMVLGGPGIGKSTFLRKIGLEALKRNGSIQRGECIPVFLDLKKFREETVNIKQKIIEEFDTCQFPAAAALVESALEQGKLLVLFDGLDEVPSKNLNRVIEKIEDFVDKHDKNRFVASCRIAAYRSSFRRFTDVTIAEFDDEQIEQFIRRWFSAPEDQELETATKYLELLNQKEHEATKELAQTPLLLTFLCLLYDRKQMLPSKRSTLYGRALDIILDEWSAQKRLERDPIHERLNPDLEKILLAQIAYESFNLDQLFFSKEVITKRIANFLADTLENPKYLNADKVLTAIEVQQGILVERATDAYSFSHLTLQEYLTALHIVENQLEGELVSKHLSKESWREVSLLVSGLMGNRALQLLIAMEQQARAYIEPYEKLKNLVQWAAINKVGESKLYERAAMLVIASMIAIGQASNSVSSINGIPVSHISAIGSARLIAKDVFKVSGNSSSSISNVIRSASVIPIIDSMINDIGIGIGMYDNSAIGHINNVSYACVDSDIYLKHHFLNIQSLRFTADELSNLVQQSLPEKDKSFADWLKWNGRLQFIWLAALELNHEAIIFSYEETEALKNYLYATELLIRCKESAIRVPRSEWVALEARLLTI